MTSFAIVHNIPSPYRLHLFRALAAELSRRSIRLHVHFMARGHQERAHWATGQDAFGFDYTFWRDVGPVGGGPSSHVNPSMLLEVVRHRPDYLMVGGPWATLTGMLVSAVTRREGAIGWLEGNVKTPGRIGGAVGLAKIAILQRYGFLALPGQSGIDFVRLLFGTRRHPPLAILPNVVDETAFRDDTLRGQAASVRADLRVRSGHRLAIWNARLNKAKGVAEFLDKVTAEDLTGWDVVVLGDGPERGHVLESIRRRGLGDAVRIAPYQAYERMPAIYHAADLMLLPSMSDPNPLSVVEALHAGLPLLVSDRLGNCPEAVRDGENGWTVDPSSVASVRTALRNALGSSPEILTAMGHRSRGRADFWRTSAAVERFLDTVLDAKSPRS